MLRRGLGDLTLDVQAMDEHGSNPDPKFRRAKTTDTVERTQGEAQNED